MQKGQTFLAAGNLEKARVEFRNALQIAPTDGEARFENGVVDEKLGNRREAAQFYQGAIDVSPDNIRARVALGRIYAQSGQPDQALATITPGFAQHPDDPGLLMVRAAARAELNNPAAALEDAERAVKLAPTNEDAVSVLADIYRSGGKVDEAIALLEGAVKQLPDAVTVRLELAQLYASRNEAPQAEALLADLIRIKPTEKVHRLRLAQFYASDTKIDDAERVLRDGIKALPSELDLKIGLVDLLAARRSREIAEKQLLDFITQDPKNQELRFALARFYELGKNYAKAEATYNQVIAASGFEGPGITARDRLAALRVQQNDVAGAEKLLAEVLAKVPRDDDALFLRGTLAAVQKDPKTAIADLRSVLRDQPNSVGVMRVLARAHLANGEPALAEETMQRAVESNPADASARLDLARLLVSLGKPERAKPIIDELIKQQPNNTDALQEQFKIAAASKDSVSAKAAADAIVAINPKLEIGYYYQGLAADTDQRRGDAIQLYSSALERQPTAAEPLRALTSALIRENRLSEALQRLDEVIARYPQNAFAANLKGEILVSQKRTTEAKAAFKTAIEREPANSLAYRNLAVTQMNEHDDGGAIATLEDAIAKVGTPEPLEALLAGLYERSGKTDAAVQVYENGLRRNPNSQLIANNLAMLLVDTRKDASSLERAQQLSARLSGSNDPNFLDTYGWVLYKRGEAAAAVAALQKASSRAPGLPEPWYHLGMAQVSAGQPEAARTSLTHSLESGQSFSGIDEAKATLDRLAKPVAANGVPKS